MFSLYFFYSFLNVVDENSYKFLNLCFSFKTCPWRFVFFYSMKPTTVVVFGNGFSKVDYVNSKKCNGNSRYYSLIVTRRCANNLSIEFIDPYLYEPDLNGSKVLHWVCFDIILKKSMNLKRFWIAAWIVFYRYLKNNLFYFNEVLSAKK